MRNLVTAMVGGRVQRLVALSGAGVDVPGDRKPVLDRIISGVVRRFAGHVVGAKQREFTIFSASELDWTALRPPLVTDGSARGYRLELSLQPGARVTRADVAQGLVDQLVDRAFIRAAPSCYRLVSPLPDAHAAGNAGHSPPVFLDGHQGERPAPVASR